MEFLGAVAGWAVSSGVMAYLFKRWLDRALDKAEKEARQRSEDRKARWMVDDQYCHAVGRTLFWLCHGIRELEKETGKHYWNGDLQEAYEAVNQAEQQRKELDRRQLADMNEE